MSTAITGAALSRRGFLAGAGGVLGALALASCSTDTGGSSTGGSLSVVLPGTAPTGWERIQAAVNEKMQADLGFGFAPEFINWQNYASQSLLKFTAGEPFETALSARWLNMASLVDSGALVALNEYVDSGDYPNLNDTVSDVALSANQWGDQIYGVPAVNSAARLHHYVARADLVDAYAGGSIETYDQLEKFWYDVHQHEGILGYVARLSVYGVLAAPTGVYNRASWEDPSTIPLYFNGDSMHFIPAKDASVTGSSGLVPFWEVDSYVQALRDLRRYYEDGIINADMLNVDAATVSSQFQAGAAASAWAITDGTSTAGGLPQLQKAVPGASLMQILPLADPGAKPNQTFQADNNVVLNAAGTSTERTMQMLDWFSIPENHHLVEYGVEGEDWNAVGEDRYEAISDYQGWPGYALTWRVPLQLKSSLISESEDRIFTWAQDYDNFTTDPFASFIPDLAPVETENAQVTAVMAEYGNPLFCGAVDVDKGLDDLKRALDSAGVEKLRTELETQADAYLAGQ